MKGSRSLHLAALLGLSLAGPASADVWDIQFDNDDSNETDNQLLHGTIQTHDLGARPGPTADQDWFLMPQKMFASYEIILDGVSGDVGASGLALHRIASDGFTVVQTDTPAMMGTPPYSRALRWGNANPQTEFIRVSGALCGTACGSDDVYTIRARETTVNLARFNNSGSQVTVLLIQNVTERPVNAVFYYWGAGGGNYLFASELPNLPPKGLHVFSSNSAPALAGQSGHITITHDGGYGGLVAKAVALEPSTGFTFDTPGVYVPY
jgi:hypothetical protein